jgi:hypothetical protein
MKNLVLSHRAGILEQSMGARNRVGIGLSYRPAMLHKLTGRCDNSVPTRFLAPVGCSKIPAQSHHAVYSLRTGRHHCALSIGAEHHSDIGNLFFTPLPTAAWSKKRILNANSCTRWHGIFKGFSQAGGRASFSKNLRASLFNECLSNESNFGWSISLDSIFNVEFHVKIPLTYVT